VDDWTDCWIVGGLMAGFVCFLLVIVLAFLGFQAFIWHMIASLS
jgi:hypothetical protein